MTQGFERRVVRAIRRHGLVRPGDRVAVALSGGPDSVALALVLRRVLPGLGGDLAGLVHVHHGLRGTDADADEVFCRGLADRLGVPIDVGRVDVAAHQRASGRSLEAAARDLRYACFDAAARRLDASRVATGHTRDDQAETVLLRLLRGAGTRGLAGIRVRRGPFIRPLLDCSRLEVLAYLAARGETCCRDASNELRSIARNRIRHDLLPVIDAIAPGGRRALARVADLAADDEAFFRQVVIEMSPGVVLPDTGVSVPGLLALPPAVARRVVRHVIETVAPGASVTARHLGAVVALAASARGAGRVDLAGVTVTRVGPALRIARASGAPPAASDFEYVLPCPGQVAVAEAGATVVASPDGVGESAGERVAGDRVAVQRAAFRPPFRVRNRRAGDLFRPLGAPGRRKLQDVLTDRKVPREARDRVLVVTDADNRIVWVAGVAMAEEGRVTAPSAGVVVLSVKKGLL